VRFFQKITSLPFAFIHQIEKLIDCTSLSNSQMQRDYSHFLGKAAWRVKNVQGAIDVIKRTRTEKLIVMGGSRLNFKMGFRLTLSSGIRF
jgi:hypothetical protein